MFKFVKGAFLGSVIGGVYGLWIAPRPGKETRQALQEYFDQIESDATDVRYALDNFNLALHRLVDEGLPSIQRAADEIQDSVTSFTQETEPHLRRINRQIQTLESDIAPQTIQINSSKGDHF